MGGEIEAWVEVLDGGGEVWVELWKHGERDGGVEARVECGGVGGGVEWKCGSLGGVVEAWGKW